MLLLKTQIDSSPFKSSWICYASDLHKLTQTQSKIFCTTDEKKKQKKLSGAQMVTDMALVLKFYSPLPKWFDCLETAEMVSYFFKAINIHWFLTSIQKHHLYYPLYFIQNAKLQSFSFKLTHVQTEALSFFSTYIYTYINGRS